MACQAVLNTPLHYQSHDQYWEQSGLCTYQNMPTVTETKPHMYSLSGGEQVRSFLINDSALLIHIKVYSVFQQERSLASAPGFLF